MTGEDSGRPIAAPDDLSERIRELRAIVLSRRLDDEAKAKRIAGDEAIERLRLCLGIERAATCKLVIEAACQAQRAHTWMNVKRHMAPGSKRPPRTVHRRVVEVGCEAWIASGKSSLAVGNARAEGPLTRFLEELMAALRLSDGPKKRGIREWVEKYKSGERIDWSGILPG